MSLKLKALVAAVAIAAAANASAAINDVTAAAGSDLLFFAINSDGASFVQDLGVQAGNFTGAATQNWTAGSAYATFVTGSTDATTITWGVAAGYAGSGLTKYVESTVQVGADTSALINSNVGTVSSGTGAGVIHNVIANATAAQVAVAGSTGIYSTGPGANWATYSGSDFLTNYPFAIDNAVGTTGVEFMKAGMGGIGAANTLATQSAFTGTFGFDGTSLSYTVAVAAVPEPETYGMLAAGLLMLGAVARRRKA